MTTSTNDIVQVSVKSPTSTSVFKIRRGMAFQGLSAKQETAIEYSCREGDCGICAIRILKGAENLSPQNPVERDFLKAMRAEPNERLACQTRILGDVEIEVDYL